MKTETKKPVWVNYLKFTIVTALYIAFLVWVKSWMGIVVIPFIFDAYITKKIPWTWWKDAEDAMVRNLMSWVDAIVFALVAVYFVNQFFFQNYQIPSSSLEKSLLTGDYLFVSKMSYGPRIPQTPLTVPLTQHTMPLFNTPSYVEWPHWDYRRVKGLGTVKQNDIVVFNYPAGDTVAVYRQNSDYYGMAYGYGQQVYYEATGIMPNVQALTRQQQRDFYAVCYTLGKQYMAENIQQFGPIISRPTDRRENYVKRCVGLPGQTLEIKNKVIYTDGKPNKEPDNVQYNYSLTLLREIPEDLARQLQLSEEDLIALHQYGEMPLTHHAYEELKSRKDIVDHIEICNSTSTDGLYPHTIYTGWTCDNYGPIWIPQKGKSIHLTMDNISIYERPIRIYEGHDLEVKDNKIYIDGKECYDYTFQLDYYWMMGDNRHNSADSRYWGFVPEDHVVGKPIFVWLSLDPDRTLFDGKIRWNRFFLWVDNIK